MAKFTKLTKRGFTLIELMIVVVIIGILASLAIYGVQKYVANSKSAEARMMLGRMQKDVQIQWEGEKMAGTSLALGGTVGSTHLICSSVASGDTVPSTKDLIKGKKYQPAPSEWSTGTDFIGWSCLNTSITAPIYFMYNYTSTIAAPSSGVAAIPTAGILVTAIAQGDLDGDGVLSTFSLGGKVLEESNEKLIAFDPAITELNAEE